MYLVSVPGSRNKPPKALGVSWVREVSFVICKEPVLRTLEFKLMRSLRVRPQDSTRKTNWSEGWNFRPHPSTSGNGEALQIKLYKNSWAAVHERPWKINTQKPQLNRAGRPEGGALAACDRSRDQQEGGGLLFSPSKDAASEKPRPLCLLQLPFPLYKRVLLPLPWGNLHMACHACRPQTDPK